MPNVAPRGLHARHGNQWKPPVNVLARDDDQWKQADFVWGAGPGDNEWHVIWARTGGSPVSATASYSPTEVEINWVLASPLIADGYRIRRPDGSVAGTVNNPNVTTFTDANPRPLNGTYTVCALLAGQESETCAVTNSLDLRFDGFNASVTILNNGSDNPQAQVSWSHPAVGRADNYRIYRGGGAYLGQVAGTVTSFTTTSIAPGHENNYYVRAVLSGTIAPGQSTLATANVFPRPPRNVTLTATNPPLSNLRIGWDAPSGTYEGFQTQMRHVGDSFGATQNHGSSVRHRDWGTTQSGYGRVRSTVAGIGNSDWVTTGQATPINDVTPPPNVAVISYGPEASYGRMVIRFRTPDVADFHSYRVQYNTENPGNWVTGWTNLHGWQSAPRDVTRSHVWDTGNAGWIMQVRVQVRDNDGNVRTGPIYTYTLLASPWNADPHLSGTLRGGTWRNDATRSSNEIATGWTSSGHNMGFFFYNWAQDFEPMGGKTITSAVVEYYRENEGGLTGPVQPLFWIHNLTGRSGQGGLVRYGGALPESQRLGQGVSRSSPPDTGTFTLPTQFITRLVQGSYYGLCMYRGYAGSGNPDNYYALLGTAGQVATGGVVNGRIKFHHLG